MIQLENAKQIRVKRGNTDWWINEKAIVGENGLTYMAYVTDMGEIHIKEYDAKCSRTPSRDFRLRTMNCYYSDEHNAPSMCILKSGKILVAYTGHAANGTLNYRITQKPYDIFSFGEEQSIPYNGRVTYAQIFENVQRNEIWMFNRVDGVTWEFRYSKDEAKTWSEPHRFLASDAGGLFYLNVRKLVIPSSAGSEERWFFALYGHPRVSKDHTIRSGLFSVDGKLLKNDGSETQMSLYDNSSVMKLDELDVVYSAPEGKTVRLLDVSPTVPLRVGFAPFVMDKAEAPNPDEPYYCSATFRDGKWNVSEPICRAGEFLAKDILDGSQTYLGGMAYYYGVGEAGLYGKDIAGIETNRIFIARFDGENRVLESYISRDCGKHYELEQVIRKIPASENKKIWRPTVPVHAQDNLQVYWHEGSYGAHTGGWHCDMVMLVEHDD